MPRYARRYGASLSMRSPSNQISPRSSGIVPSIRLKSVVFPEPFGPISAVIVPRSTDRFTPSTALTPPKRFSALLTSRIGPAGASAASSAARSTTRIGLRSKRAPTSVAFPASRRRFTMSPMLGMIPRGRQRTTSMSSVPKKMRRTFASQIPPGTQSLKLLFVIWFTGSRMNAPITGPQIVPRPPSRTASTTNTL